MTTKTKTQQDYRQNELDLEREFQVTDQDIERAYRKFVSKDKPKKKSRALQTTASAFGGVMLVVTFMMMLQMAGIPAGPEISFTNHILLPVIGALLVLLGWSALKRNGNKPKEPVYEEPVLKVNSREKSNAGANAGSRGFQQQETRKTTYRDFRVNDEPGKSFAEKVAASAEKKKQEPYALSRKKTIYRSRTDKKIFGVCGGIADYLGIDSTLVRIIFALTLVFYGTPAFLYIALRFILRKEPVD